MARPRKNRARPQLVNGQPKCHLGIAQARSHRATRRGLRSEARDDNPLQDRARPLSLERLYRLLPLNDDVRLRQPQLAAVTHGDEHLSLRRLHDGRRITLAVGPRDEASRSGRVTGDGVAQRAEGGAQRSEAGDGRVAERVRRLPSLLREVLRRRGGYPGACGYPGCCGRCA